MPDFMKFLGTAGARIVLAKQLRASGGIWLNLDDTNLYIDPGPGALVHCWKSRPKLDPAKLDGILLSHRHLDHSGDINVMIEAMTESTFKKKGVVLAPSEALDADPVILKYLRKYPEKIEHIKVGTTYKIKNLAVTCPLRHQHHGSETYGFKIKGKKLVISYISDTLYFSGLLKAYARSDIVIANILGVAPGPFDHLNAEDIKKLARGIKPKLIIMTHFGRQMLARRPWEIAELLTRELKITVIAAGDGMLIPL